MHPGIMDSRAKAARVYVFRGMFYGSLSWPLFMVILLFVASWYSSRPGWRVPDIRWPRR